ncbi:Peptide-methionine (S)-S-oxide reductase [Alteripontixanthobacter maritimus]|uniref:Peptide methionine sulfoxide reductase MsrA n=1 Tax=Alteripontixanthobacter maritimus TaxID=2161824 RepID=A0A369QDB7_9SPHN|nr:peptide-methionine (S)-S-oxide reductase MsrA [Alteripontixanthobacter maritimus]RDC61237.1 Peptide-methionine (S)-S-oxide reductase [Alteripontixanthobacter maritimus]
MRRILPFFAAAGLVLSACNGPAIAAENVVAAPLAKRVAKEGAGLKTAIFAGGCFWGIEAVFSHTKGVKSAIAGYHGGNKATATYAQTNTGVTGHAEAVKVVYDPKVVRYDQLLRIFFSVGADPTVRNRQGPDRGPQYRAALVPVSKEQRIVAASYLKQMQASGKWSRPIVTEIEPHKTFYKAEAYHQDFAAKNPGHPYIRRWDAPKVNALKRLYPSKYRATFKRG